MMRTVYIYDGVEYQSLRELRMKVTHLVFADDCSDEMLAEIGITKEEQEVVQSPTVQAAMVRMRRDQLLRECDFYVMPDYPSTEEGLESVKQYRQLLRDLPNQEGFPQSVVFPEIPEVLKDVQ